MTGAWDGGVRLWDLREGREWHTFTGHPSAVHGVAFTPDGSSMSSTQPMCCTCGSESAWL